MENDKHRKKQREEAEEPRNGAAKNGPAGAAQAPAAAEPAAETAGKAKDYYDQLLRLQADFANYRKRVEKEKPELVCFGKAQLLLTLLPLYDLLMKAHQHVCDAKGCAGDDPAKIQDVVTGLEMIFREFSKVFEAEGIRPMDLVGRPYDPMACEIIGIDEGDDKNDGLVTEEFQKGFYYGDKVLRPAKVKIAKKKAAAPAAPEVPAEKEQSEP